MKVQNLKTKITLIAILFFAFCLINQTTAVYAELPKVNYLKNGLKIITLEDHSAPVISFMIWYKVGARNEKTGQTGISHLLEHMLFKSTKNYPGGSLVKIIEQNGGLYNGFTSQDYTSYYEVLASDRLEVALKVESERMVNGLIDPQEQKPEISVVLSELEGNENDPVELLWRAVNATAFTVHPYRNPVIGWKNEVMKLPAEEVEKYYKTYYHPNNATVVLVGDFKTDEAVKLIEKYFGDIPKVEIPQENIIQEPVQKGKKELVLNQTEKTQYLILTYHIPAIDSPDLYPLYLLADILTSGKNSRLYKSLVLTNLTAGIECYVDQGKDPGLLTLFATINQGQDVNKVKEVIFSELENVKQKGVTQEELTRALNQETADYISKQDSVRSVAYAFGMYESIYSYEYILTLIPNLKKVTLNDIKDTANKYLVDDNLTEGYSVYKQPEIVKEKVKTKVKVKSENESKKYEESVVSAKNNKEKKLPEITQLKNGTKIIFYEDNSTPLFAVRGSLNAGDTKETKDNFGLASYTALMLNKGTKSKTLLQIAQILEDIGATISFAASKETVDFTAGGQSKDFNTIIDLLADMLQNPSFPDEEWQRLKPQILTSLQQGEDNPEVRAENELYTILFPKDNPYYMPTYEEEKTSLNNITVADFKNFYSKNYLPQDLVLVISGDLKKEKTLKKISELFEKWNSAEKSTTPEIKNPDYKLKPETKIISQPEKSQVQVNLGFPLNLTRESKDFYTFNVLNYIFGGGALTSRLNYKIREEKGYVYYVYSYFDRGKIPGAFVITFGANKKNVDDALKIIQEEIQKIIDKGITKEELQDAVNYITGAYPIRLETNSGMAENIYLAYYFNLGLDFPWNINKYYKDLTVEQVNEVAKKYLSTDYKTVIVGDYKK